MEEWMAKKVFQQHFGIFNVHTSGATLFCSLEERTPRGTSEPRDGFRAFSTSSNFGGNRIHHRHIFREGAFSSDLFFSLPSFLIDIGTLLQPISRLNTSKHLQKRIKTKGNHHGNKPSIPITTPLLPSLLFFLLLHQSRPAKVPFTLNNNIGNSHNSKSNNTNN